MIEGIADETTVHILVFHTPLFQKAIPELWLMPPGPGRDVADRSVDIQAKDSLGISVRPCECEITSPAETFDTDLFVQIESRDNIVIERFGQFDGPGTAV